MENKEHNATGWIVVAIISFIAICSYMSYRNYQYEWTRKKAVAIAKTSMDDLPEETVLGEADWWDNKFNFEREVTDDYIRQTITSPGRDGVSGTKDDIVAIDTDWNKSRIAGRWMKDKSGEFFKGIFRDKTKNRFEKHAEKEKE